MTKRISSQVRQWVYATTYYPNIDVNSAQALPCRRAVRLPASIWLRKEAAFRVRVRVEVWPPNCYSRRV